MVEFSPATREARVRFPDVAILFFFSDKKQLELNDRIIELQSELAELKAENDSTPYKVNFHFRFKAIIYKM